MNRHFRGALANFNRSHFSAILGGDLDQIIGTVTPQAGFETLAVSTLTGMSAILDPASYSYDGSPATSAQLQINGSNAATSDIMAEGDVVTVLVSATGAPDRSFVIVSAVEYLVNVDTTGGTFELDINPNAPPELVGTFDFTIASNSPTYPDETVTIDPANVTPYDVLIPGAVTLDGANIAYVPPLIVVLDGTTVENIGVTVALDAVAMDPQPALSVDADGTYTFAHGDVAGVYTFTHSVDIGGATVTTPAPAGVTVAVAGVPTTLVATNAASRLRSSTPYTGASPRWGMMLSFVFPAGGSNDQAIVDGSTYYMLLDDQQEIRFAFPGVSQVRLLNQYAPDDQINLLWTMDTAGVNRMATQINGGGWSTIWTDATAPGGSWGVQRDTAFFDNRSANKPSNIEIRGFAAWTGGDAMPADSAGLQGAFFEPNGAFREDPADYRAYFASLTNSPSTDIEFFGDAAQFNNASNAGSSTGWTATNGFTDAP